VGNRKFLIEKLAMVTRLLSGKDSSRAGRLLGKNPEMNGFRLRVWGVWKESKFRGIMAYLNRPNFEVVGMFWDFSAGIAFRSKSEKQ
jgi:hypothetical protein